ncbi:MAG: hypothetical protein PHC41_00735 [Lachnospiraceae bacterium]|nr:hypothetical protein [Lachnospiraceae bacterium]MDD3614730.1 hypothetical protein [Lachnospiraceae bacterium]
MYFQDSFDRVKFQSLLYEEREQELEMERMRQYYPETARLILDKVQEACDLMEYEGSRMYDEVPDRFMMDRVVGRIEKGIEEEMALQAVEWTGALGDLIRVLLYQEIGKRRIRRRKMRRYYVF